MKKSLSILIVSTLIVLSTLCFANVLIELRKNIQVVNEQYQKLTEDVADKLEEDKEYSNENNNTAAGSELLINKTPDISVPENNSGYYLILRESLLLITEADKETVLEKKNMGENFLTELEDDERKALSEGIHAKDLISIYNILESLSS